MLGDTALGFQKVSTLSSSVGFTPPAGASSCLVQAETNDVRWRDDDTAPTASVGFLLQAGQTMTYRGDLARLRFIEVTASATLNVSCYR